MEQELQFQKLEPVDITEEADDVGTDFDKAFGDWQLDQTPSGNAKFLKRIDPVIEKGLSMYGHSGSPAVKAKAKLEALKAARTFDPTKAKLQTYLLTNLQSIRRIGRKTNEVIRVPERIALESSALARAEDELADDLGREPTDIEIADKMGISLTRIQKIRTYTPGVLSSSTLQEGDDDMQEEPASRSPREQGANKYWLDMVYGQLDPLDKKIMEYSFGMYGRPRLTNNEIAAKLKRSPGAVSQRKSKIQAILDRESTLSPF